MDRTRAPFIGKYEQTVTVAKAGGQYTSIQAAINGISDSAADKRYCVLVYPGTYTEVVTMKAYVDVVGVDRQATKISNPTPLAANTVSMAANSSLYNLTISTGDHVTYVNVYLNDTDNVRVADCDLLGGRWAIHAATACDDVEIDGCYFNQPNPIISYGDSWRITHNTCVTSANVTSCLTLVDGVPTNSYIANNCYKGANTAANSGYIIAFGLSGNVYANNTFDVTSAKADYTVFYSSYSAAASGTNYAYGNTVRIHCTAANPTLACLYVSTGDGTSPTPNTTLNGNTIHYTSDNNLTAAYSVRVVEDGAMRDDVTQMPYPTGPSITTDRQSVAISGSAVVPTADCRHATLTWRTPATGTMRNTSQMHMNVAAAADDSVWSVAAGYSAIDLTSTEAVLLVDGSSEYLTVTPARCLRVTGGQAGANGTVRIHGWDVNNRYQYEDFVVSGTTDIEGSKAFSTLWFFQVTVAGDAGETATIGANDKIGLREPILATGDVVAVAKGDGSSTRNILGAPGTVNVANCTVDCGTLSANDEIEIYYLTPV